MNKSSLLTQLALAGIAAGLVSAYAAETAAIPADSLKPAAAGDSAKPAKKVKKPKKKKSAVADSSVKADSAVQTIPPPMMHDSSMQKHMQDSAMRGKSGMTRDKHSCKGQNSCKGLGGCAMNQKALEAAAKKMGLAVDKAGQPHGCKGMNECKGLGGCGMM